MDKESHVDWRHLKSALRDAQFREAQRIAEDIDWKHVNHLAIHDNEIEAITAVSMSSELLDYLGKFSESLDRIAKLAEHVIPQLQELQRGGMGGPRTMEERRRLKAQVWVLFHRGMNHYRRQEYDRARQFFTLGIDLCRRWLDRAPDYSCRGTLARLHYGLGLVDREQHAYRQAQDHFLASVSWAWPTVLEASVRTGAQEQSRWTDIAVARAVALGLAYIHHDLGQPVLALPLLLQARISLARVEDRLLARMVDVIYYNTIRSAYGDDPARLDEAIEGLRSCYEEFSARKHDLYAMRSAHSLSLALLQRVPDRSFVHLNTRDLDQAEGYCDDAEARSFALDDAKIRLLLLVCRSRIERKRGHFAKAEERAREAMDRGADQYPLIRVRALTARAEALMQLGRYDEALQDLVQCDRDDADIFNPRLRAVAVLRQAEIYVAMNESKLADEAMERYRRISQGVANAQTRALEHLVRTGLKRVKENQDFVLRLADDYLRPEQTEQEFHRFLVKWAKARSKTDTEAALKLGISRQTLFTWAKDSTQQPVPRDATAVGTDASSQAKPVTRGARAVKNGGKASNRTGSPSRRSKK
jgi:tetratricopeptide (TPR) repeat protein